jgi:hypothetical protein
MEQETVISDFKITLFAHVRNEEELIPYWLKHHKHMFDHGVIIDYFSSDNTINIIKEICPSWEIVEPTEEFGACVNLIHDLECKYNGWKITLNVTEFLFIDNLRKFIINFEKEHPNLCGIRTRGCIIVDNNEIFDYEKPITLQYTNGYFEEDIEQLGNVNDLNTEIFNANEHIQKTANWINLGIDGRSRLLHKCETGLYLQGRHSTLHENVYPRNTRTSPESDLILLYFGYAPYNICKIRHFKNCTTRISQLNIDELILCHRNISYNLLKDNRYKVMFNVLDNNI